jgi:hypothetical protein
MVPTCALATVPGMSVPALRPLRVGEILDAGIKVYLKNARTLMGLTAVVVVPFQLLSAIVLLSSVSYGSQVPGSFPTLTAPRTGDHAASLGANVILQVTGVLIGLLTTAACVKAVSDIYLDQPTDVRSSLRFALRRLGSLFWVEVIVIVGLTFAFLALLIPGIWLYAAWSVTTPALLIEGRRGPSAIGRSFRLVRGRWWPTAGVRLLSNILHHRRAGRHPARWRQGIGGPDGDCGVVRRRDLGDSHTTVSGSRDDDPLLRPACASRGL